VDHRESDEQPLFRSVAEIRSSQGEIPKRVAVAPRFAYRGRTTLLAAREKLGKSTVSRAIAASVSRGATLLGQQSQQGNVLWLALEEHPNDFMTELTRFRADESQIFLMRTMVDAQAELSDAVRKLHPSLVVIDTLPAYGRRIGVTEANSSAQWTDAMMPLNVLARETDAAFLILHHAKKDTGTYRDSTAIGANVDMILEMKESGDLRLIECTGRWNEEDFTIELVDDGSTSFFRLVGGHKSRKEELLDLVGRSPGLSKRQVASQIEGRTAEVHGLVDQLLSSGELVNHGSSRGYKLYLPMKEVILEDDSDVS
jgi:hypothetical protein